VMLSMADGATGMGASLPRRGLVRWSYPENERESIDMRPRAGTPAHMCGHAQPDSDRQAALPVRLARPFWGSRHGTQGAAARNATRHPADYD
jgi:hypothetical protein